jgi:hypothetical protein
MLSLIIILNDCDHDHDISFIKKGEAVLQEEARQVLRILQKQEEIIKSYRPFSGPVSSSL